MPQKERFVKAFDRSSRARYHAQRDKLRRLSPQEVVEHFDSEDKDFRHIDRVETRKSKQTRRTLVSELGEDTGSSED